MTSLDFSPLFRSTIGFDRLSRLAEAATRADTSAYSYPPYNIEKVDEDQYRVTMAVAGFGSDTLDITVEANTLTVKGELPKNDKGEYLYRGIATRSFERRFQLADHLQVTGAALTDGMLTIDLKREIPEALKPRRIEIGHAGEPAGETRAAA